LLFFDTSDPSVPPPVSTRSASAHCRARGHRPLAAWLLVCAALIFAMIVLGGVTRLTQSGLSMVDWHPVSGVIPPMNDADWQLEFERYQQFPEFKYVNRDMDLAGFKRIFYVEYFHRLLGRLIGFVFLIPFLYFLIRGRIDRSLGIRLGTVFGLGALQGLLGWLMVRSGLVHDPHVSHYRLTAHLALAVVLYGWVLWLAMGLWRARLERACTSTGYRAAVVVVTLVGAMIVSGGFVAGTRAGFIYNTFPDMNGVWLPAEAFLLSPLWLNMVENPVAIQLIHRLGALLTAIAVLILIWKVSAGAERAGQRRAAWLLGAATALQIALGITTLLHHVPVALGAAHQAGALVLFSAVLYCLHVFTRQDEDFLPGHPDAG